jgi:hypothetical protein
MLGKDFLEAIESLSGDLKLFMLER